MPRGVRTKGSISRCTSCCYQAIALTENCYRQRDCKKSGRELEEKRRAALCQRYHRRIFTETLPCSAEFSHHVARAQNGQIPGSSQSGCRLLKPRFHQDQNHRQPAARLQETARYPSRNRPGREESPKKIKVAHYQNAGKNASLFVFRSRPPLGHGDGKNSNASNWLAPPYKANFSFIKGCSIQQGSNDRAPNDVDQKMESNQRIKIFPQLHQQPKEENQPNERPGRRSLPHVVQTEQY